MHSCGAFDQGKQIMCGRSVDRLSQTWPTSPRSNDLRSKNQKVKESASKESAIEATKNKHVGRYTFQHFSGVASINLTGNAIEAFNNNSALSFLDGLQTVDLSMNANLHCANPAPGVAYIGAEGLAACQVPPCARAYGARFLELGRRDWWFVSGVRVILV